MRKSSGFRLGSSIGEMHDSPIYAVNWSADLYETQPLDKKHGDEDTKESINSNVNGISQRQNLVRCFATCGSNYVTIYEVNAKAGKNNMGSINHQSSNDISSGASLLFSVFVQLYLFGDVDYGDNGYGW